MNKINRTNCKRHEIHVLKLELCCGFLAAVNLNALILMSPFIRNQIPLIISSLRLKKINNRNENFILF